MIALKSHTSHTHNKYMDHGSERHTKNSLVIEIFFNVWKKILSIEIVIKSTTKKRENSIDSTMMMMTLLLLFVVVQYKLLLMDGWINRFVDRSSVSVHVHRTIKLYIISINLMKLSLNNNTGLS